MSGIGEYVAEGHRCGREAVYVEGFKLSFQEMNHDECEGVCLEFGCSGCAGEEKVEDRMDKDGAEVFEDEGCSPCYLRPCNGGVWG